MKISRFLAALTVSAAAFGCGDDDPTPPNPNANLSISVVSATNNQIGVVGTAVTALQAKVTNADGDPVASKTVNWTVSAGGGSVTPASSVTNAEGIATTTLTLGPTQATNTVTATISDQPTKTTAFTAQAKWEEWISTMTSAGEPTNTGVSAIGTATYQLVSGNTINYTVNVPSGLTGTWTGLHIHGPWTSAAASAPVVVNLCPASAACAITSGAFTTSGSFTAANIVFTAAFTGTDQQKFDSLLVLMRKGDGAAYTNLHTSVNTSGQIRGPVVTKPPTAAPARRED